MEDITLSAIYHEIKSVKKELKRLESIVVPEIKLSKKELSELKMLREEARKEIKEGKWTRAEDL